MAAKRHDETQRAKDAPRYDFSFTQNRELSWIRFDERVLDEAFDETVPLFERLKFVSIFESNLDEFFMVRVGGLSDLATLKRQPRDNKSDLTPAEQVDAILNAIVEPCRRSVEAFGLIESRLAEHGLERLEADALVGEDRTFVESYFKAYISPIISPLVIDPRHPFPNLRNGALYIACGLSGHDEEGLIGLIEVPSSLPRCVTVPGSGAGMRYILLEDVILACLPGCFGIYAPQDSAVIRVTRNADINPDGEGVEEDEDYRQHMKRILKKRLRLQPVLLTYRGGLARKTLKHIRRALGLAGRSCLNVERPLSLGYVFSLESHIPENERASLLFGPFSPQPCPEFREGRSMREQVIEGDKLLFYPYESMSTLLDLVHEAAYDDECLSIRITLYRVAKQSRLCESLIAAAEMGREVTVLMELRARFDEANNIEWAERLEEAGCTVIYGSEGFKCHSKICQITYRTGMALTRITLLGTGNFNEKTAKLYSDFMLMTAHPGIGEDANQFFRNLTLGNLRGDYRYLGVAPTGLKPLIMNGLNREIDRARSGVPARVFFKLNSLTDREVIDKISEASRAGVRVEMVIRGISCLLPGIPGKTENVRIRSIVGRFLEHARVYAFGEDVDTVYLSSADMMTRNTEHRVEIAYPVLDAELRARVIEYMRIQLSDNVKARELDSDGMWRPVPRREGEPDFNAQETLLTMAYRKAAMAAEDAGAPARTTSAAAASAPSTAVPEPESAAALTTAAASTPAPAEEDVGTTASEPMGAEAASTVSERRDASAPAAGDPATVTPVRAELIEPEDEPERPAPAGELAARDGGRMVRGLALIGLGLKTLLFGSKRTER